MAENIEPLKCLTAVVAVASAFPVDDVMPLCRSLLHELFLLYTHGCTEQEVRSVFVVTPWLCIARATNIAHTGGTSRLAR